RREAGWPEAAAAALQIGTRARRGWIHGRRVRDRGAARARPAVGQPHRERVRRVRRDERWVVRRGGGSQRHHAGGDDARDRPAGPIAVSRRARWLATEAELRGVLHQGPVDALAARAAAAY